MKIKFFTFFLIIITSCSVDYDYDLKSNDPEAIIVNGILNPASPIEIQLYKLQIANNQYNYTGLEGAKVIFKEDQIVLFDDICTDSVFAMNYYPRASATYSIEVYYDNLKTVNASTQVPLAITCNSIFNFGKDYWDALEYIIKLDSFEIPEMEKISLLITAYQVFQDNKELQYNELYTSHALVDKTNNTAGMDIRNEYVGSVYYNGFIRVKNKNLPYLDELIFTPNYVTVIEKNIEMPESPQTKIKVRIITTSPEYDQFCKSLYKQKSMIVYDGDLSSIFFQPKAVYSNIEHGHGIFAGINEVSVLFDLPDENTEK